MDDRVKLDIDTPLVAWERCLEASERAADPRMKTMWRRYAEYHKREIERRTR